ncbi:hypothetical protein [Endozoicomonas atrinae]|uniref:hypothetical protein n=1 Tax=Endozoicomonas atrinae TaxID=1333660 RepID=UPI00082424E4|nr:hypothetical protein [Endozoicomonas atrinae]
MLKKILIIGIASTLFTGCASQVKIEQISNKRIGYSSPIGYESNLCHGYTGITVFQNTGTKHELSSSISKMYQDALELGIKNTGNTPVYLGELSLINNSEYAKFSEWDHSIALTDNGKRYLNKKIKDENIDGCSL